MINVEYNQLDPLLRATGHADGDVNDETGYSPFPGNINQVIFRHMFSMHNMFKGLACLIYKWNFLDSMISGLRCN